VAEPPSTRWLALIAGLLFLNTLLLVGVLFRMGPSQVTSAAPGVKALNTDTPVAPRPEPTRPVRTGSDAAPTGGALDAVFASLVTPLERAVADMGGDAAQVLPAEADVAAAVATGRLDSAESKAVLDKLEAGYAAHNMPFPELGGP
jgi:hypothetical protein